MPISTTHWTVIATALATVGLLAQARPPDAKTVRTATAAYVAHFESEIAFAVADEDTTQLVLDAQNQPSGQRSMHGELFLTFLPEDREWIAVHDVQTIDGAPVSDHQDVQALLDKGKLRTIAGLVANHNAQYNIGDIPRNFNEPTLALLIFEPKRLNGFKFEATPSAPDAGVPVVRLTFKEHEDDTLIHQGPALKPMPASGDILVEPDTGAIHRTRLTLDQGGMSVALTTIYTVDEKLQMRVPALFIERYERTGSSHETIQCESHYTNYRRFDTFAHIK